MRTRRRATRRHFLKTMAVTAICPPALALPKAAKEGDALRTTPPQQPQQPLTPSAAAEALGQLVRARYGQFLTAEQLAEVVRQIERNLRSAERLRSVALTNADEPDLVFRAMP
ncbi:hypothetical protein HRbin08_00091 [bacterium HR08]|nr:hypothetical protein HRbin08_00091 [bacterium HR08]